MQSKCMRTHLAHMRAHLVPRAPILDRDMCDKCADRRTEHGGRPVYQIEHFKHIPIILHMKIKSWII